MNKWTLKRKIKEMGPPKRSLGLKPTRKKIPNLLDRVREHILWLRDHGAEDAKKNEKYFGGTVTKERIAEYFGVRQGEIQKCFQQLNLEGIMSQAQKIRDSDGDWVPDRYSIYDWKRLPDTSPVIEPIFEFKNCPICDNELVDNSQKKTRYGYVMNTGFNMCCPNKCFEHSLTQEGNLVKIYGEQFHFKETLGKGLVDQTKHDMNKKIAYWKKNYRYLMKLFLEDE